MASPLTNTLHLDSNNVKDALEFANSIPGYTHTAGSATYQEVSLLKIFPQIQNTQEIQSIFSSSEISRITEFANGFTIFGNVDLLTIPNQHGFWSWYLLFPVLCFASNVGSSVIMQRMNRQNQAMQSQGCMKVIIYVLPLFSAWIAYSALISLIQSIVVSKVFSPAHMTANSEARHAALMFEQEAKVPYVYAPKKPQGDPAPNSKKKKKK